MTRINLLPWREQLRETKKKQYFVFLGVTVLLACVLVGIVDYYYASRVQYQKEKNQILVQEIRKLNAKIRQIKNIKVQRQKLFSRMLLIQKLQMNRPQVVHLFDELTKIVPKGVFIKKLECQKAGVALHGVAEANSDVSQLMRNIYASKWLSQPMLKRRPRSSR